MSVKKTVDYDDYLKAKGLFHLANEHYRKAAQFDDAAKKALGLDPDDASWIDDILCDPDPNFEKALEKDKIFVDGPADD